MPWWTLVAVLVTGPVAYASWPRRRGIDDRRARSHVNTFQGKVEAWNNDRAHIGGGF